MLVDLTPLRESPAFARLWIGSSVANIGSQVTIVAVGLHIYQITGSTFAVSLVALWSLGPMIVAGLLGGALADRYDRRLVALITALLAWASIGTMTLIAFVGVELTWPYYALAAVNAASATILGATRGAILPRLLLPQTLPAAAALNGITMGLSVTVGPAVAGVLVATVGVPWTYLLDVVLFTAAFVGIVGLPSITPEGSRAAPVLQSMRDSMRFLRQAPNVRSTFVYDIIAMTFGSPRVVFPAAGALILGGGPITVGALTASFAIGALVCSLLSGKLGNVRYQGRAVTIAIAVHGLCIALFGLVLLVSTLTLGLGLTVPATELTEPRIVAIVLAGLALAGSGAADNVSSIFRTTILQTAAPDEVRGRMQGIFFVVVAGGPRVGDLFAGALATAAAIWAPPLFGGLVVIALMVFLARLRPGFQRYDAHAPHP
ncbi:MFS transporter [Leucobacter sp. 1207-22]|uniref:MFS transporter n=1 Tax=Leucobacter sp. 1207-22 TaxID=2604456 RepID=UPI004062D4EB